MSDAEFLQQFEAAALASLPHADHVRLACLYLDRLPAAAALARLADGLARFAAAKGKPDKFHYTMTRAWLELVADARRQSPGEPAAALLSRYPVLADGGALARFYSPDVLSSAAARAGWVAPDLGPLRVAGDIMAAGPR